MPYSVAKKFMDISKTKLGTKNLTDLFQKLSGLDGTTTSKRGDRVYFSMTAEEEISQYDSPVRIEIDSVLKDAGYSLLDYLNGTATDKFGRMVKIGKILTKLKKEKLLNLFNADEFRQGTKQKKFIIVFSKHPYDIAGMSADRGWTSCMNVYDGMFKKYVSKDIAAGTFICYLTKPEDLNLNKPVARLLVKPFINIKNRNDIVYVPETKIYGTAPADFFNHVTKILDEIQNKKTGKFRLNSRLYCDSGRNQVTIATQEIKAILDSGGEAQTKEQLIALLDYFDIVSYDLNDDLSVDVHQRVNLSAKKLKMIPIKFGKVVGNFDCSSNQLTSLKNSPKVVTRDFICDDNKELKSLVGGPEEVGGYQYICDNTGISSLKGVPPDFTGTLSVSKSKSLTTLEGCPTTLARLHADSCSLKSLEGGPKSITGMTYNVSGNGLTSLRGFPNFAWDCLFDLSHNNLKTLAGIQNNKPEMFRQLNLNHNPITEFNDLPREIWGYLSLTGTPITLDQAKWVLENVNSGRYYFPRNIENKLVDDRLLAFGKKLKKESIIKTEKDRGIKW